MKTLSMSKITLLLLLMCGITAYSQQDRIEVPGDHFSLEGALELFKKSASPEEFEQLLNSADSKVNNLDLNGDGDIDYIRVIDRQEGNVHAFILQAVISENESQDVAVIELEKLANGKAVLQIIGDEDVYGIETIIEPTQEVRINAGTSTARTIVNVWTWPSVQYVYGPYYNVWISPWQWNARPFWWRPWRPVAYYVYNPWWDSYRPYYTPCYTHRVVYAHRIYQPVRTTSVVVYNRHQTQINNYRMARNADYRDRGSRNDNQTRGGVRQRTSVYNRNNGDAGGRTTVYDRQNTRSFSDTRNGNEQRRNPNFNERRPGTERNDSFSQRRTTNDFRKTPQIAQPNFDRPRQDFSNRRPDVNPAPSERAQPNYDMRSNDRGNSGNMGGAQRTLSFQRESRSSSGNRPEVQIQHQRSGSGGEGNRSGSSDRRRGRP